MYWVLLKAKRENLPTTITTNEVKYNEHSASIYSYEASNQI